ncbi:General stress protein 16O [bacterium HR30]|nr:General stress protein 16O [bacterium HR30]
MRKAFLKQMQAKLVEMRRQLLREIDKDRQQGREVTKEGGMDSYDLASEERDREISFLLTDRDREKLQAIQDALDRIEQGTYGVCESCDSEIAEGRLIAMPFTRLCVSCQAQEEKEAKLQRRYDDDRAYRQLGATDLEEES